MLKGTRREFLRKSAAAAGAVAGKAMLASPLQLSQAFLDMYVENIADVITRYDNHLLKTAPEIITDAMHSDNWHLSYHAIVTNYREAAQPLLHALMSEGVESAYPQLADHVQTGYGAYDETLEEKLKVFRSRRLLARELARMTCATRDALGHMERNAPAHIGVYLKPFDAVQSTFKIRAPAERIYLQNPTYEWAKGQILASKEGVLEFLAEMDFLESWRLRAGILPVHRVMGELLTAIEAHPINRVALADDLRDWDTSPYFNRNILNNVRRPDGETIRLVGQTWGDIASSAPNPDQPVYTGSDFFLRPADSLQDVMNDLRKRFDRKPDKEFSRQPRNLKLEWLAAAPHEGMEGPCMESQAVLILKGCAAENARSVRRVFSDAVHIVQAGQDNVVLAVGYDAPEEDFEILQRWMQQPQAISRDIQRLFLS